MARCKGYSRLRRLACSATAAAQQYPPHTSRLKTVRRTVFSTPLTLSGFESPLSIKIKATPTVLLLLGALQGIRTPDLLVRSQTLYPAELRAHGFDYIIFGGSDWNRTNDTRIFSPLLYRLSYRAKKNGGSNGTRTRDLLRDRQTC